MQQAQTACQAFTQRVGDLRRPLTLFENSFKQYLANPAGHGSILDRFAEVREAKRAFTQEYEEKAKELIQMLCRKNTDLFEFLAFEDNGRVVINRNVSDGEFILRDNEDNEWNCYFPSLIRKINGSLTLDSGAIFVDHLEEVTGSLNAAGGIIVGIQTLKRLRYVGGDMDLSDTQIKDLSSLETVGGDLELWRCRNLPESLSDLRYVGGDLSLSGSSVQNVDTLEEAGDITANYTEGPNFKTELRSMKKLKRAKTINLNGSDIHNLDSLEEVAELQLDYTTPFVLPNLKRVKDLLAVTYVPDLDIEKMFPALEEIGTQVPNDDTWTMAVSEKDREQAEAFLAKRRRKGFLRVFPD